MKTDSTPTSPSPRSTMNGKPVLFRPAKSVLTIPSPDFTEKLLCDNAVVNLGDACAYSCEFCYVACSMYKLDKPIIDQHLGRPSAPADFSKVVIRRADALGLLKSQLTNRSGQPVYGPDDRRVVLMSTLVDPAANMEILRETAEACNLILAHTHWDIRLLSKSNLLHKLVADNLIPEEFHQRLIFGFSTGTLDDEVAKAIETGTPLVSKRLEALHWLQDRGLRTFGMICPSLPQEDYDAFSRGICDAIRVDRCEHVWAEVINLRGPSLKRCIDGLRRAGLDQQADLLAHVSGPGRTEAWERYARETFSAHTKHVPGSKLRFLQYVTPYTADWWHDQRHLGSVPLGHHVKKESASPAPVKTREAALGAADVEFLTTREEIVHEAMRSSIAAAVALHEIHHYKDGLLWKKEHQTFEAYCRVKWSYAKSHAYRLLGCGGLVQQLRSTGATSLPTTEGQIRPLLALPPESRIDCWKKITAESKPQDLTAATVTQEVKNFAEAKGLDFNKATNRAEASSQVSKAIDRLRTAAATAVRSHEIERLIDKIEELLATAS